MLNKVEIMISSKTYYDKEDTKNILGLAMDNNMKGINVFGHYLNDIGGFGDLPDIYVNIDSPFGQNSTGARLAMAIDYHREYGDMIKGFNFGMLPQLTFNSQWENIKQDLEMLNNFCKDEGIESRVIMDLSTSGDIEKAQRTLGIVEEVGIGSAIIGFSTRNGLSPIDTILEISSHIKNLSMPVGVFLRNCKAETLESLNKSKFESVILLPNNILKLMQ